MAKTLVWLGFMIGSTVGGFIPMLWKGDLLSPAGIGFSVLGGLIGIFLGFQFSKSL